MSAFIDRYTVTSAPLKSERRVELVVLVLCMLLILQLLWGAYGAVFPSSPEPVLPAADSLQVSVADDPEVVAAEQREQIRQRPLFWGSRRPLQSETDTAVEEITQKPDKEKPGKISGVKLSGVFGAGDSAGIIVIAKGKKSRVMVGEELNGWTLDSVTPVEAVFSGKGQRASLALKRGTLAVTQNDSAQPDAKPGKDGEQKANASAKAPPLPGTLGLGRGDRNRGKKESK